ncbi:MAG: cobalamin biosynthesis protein [candidate division NC10 bacterium]|nr:cobalamin biosynthesis protein [candidate division NC10 bacterium]
MKSLWKLWIGLGLLILLTPLGLLARGTTWGEWAGGELKKMLGFIPEGLATLENFWKAKLAGYTLPGWNSPVLSALGYLLSAAVGVGVVIGLMFLLGRFLSTKDGNP